MTCNVLSGTLSLYTTSTTSSRCIAGTESRSRMTLKCCTNTETCWNRKLVSVISPLLIIIIIIIIYEFLVRLNIDALHESDKTLKTESLKSLHIKSSSKIKERRRV